MSYGGLGGAGLDSPDEPAGVVDREQGFGAALKGVGHTDRGLRPDGAAAVIRRGRRYGRLTRAALGGPFRTVRSGRSVAPSRWKPSTKAAPEPSI